MTFKKEYTMYCAICGGPIEDSDIDQSWLSQAVLLHSETEISNRTIRELPAKNNGGPYFELLENAEGITACDISSSITPSPKPLYIPCHTSCVSIAKRVMAAQEAAPPSNMDDLIWHLWRVLKIRFDNASEDKIGPICNIYSAQAYGEIWRFQGLVWEPGNDVELRFESMHFEANPEYIPDMTNSILSHLQTIPAEQHYPSSSDPSQFPQFDNLGLECAIQSSPSVWRELLVGGYLPWLWDVEPDAVARKEASKAPGQEWNWELLVRQLSQAHLHEPRAVLENLPMGLRNRRRIWRLVEDILSEEVIDVGRPK